MRNKIYNILVYMCDYCNKIEDTIKRYGTDIETFENDDDYKDSISMKIFQIGELVNHLPDEYLENTKEKINWNVMRGMRKKMNYST